MTRRVALRCAALAPLALLTEGRRAAADQSGDEPQLDAAAIEQYQEEQAFSAASKFVADWNEWSKKVDLSVLDVQNVAGFRKVKKAWKQVEKSFAALGYK